MVDDGIVRGRLKSSDGKMVIDFDAGVMVIHQTWRERLYSRLLRFLRWALMIFRKPDR